MSKLRTDERSDCRMDMVDQRVGVCFAQVSNFADLRASITVPRAQRPDVTLNSDRENNHGKLSVTSGRCARGTVMEARRSAK
ncbi:MAG TPA: hypothetical protein VIR01_14870, partial [Pyrinomonadaceae bacterium]